MSAASGKAKGHTTSWIGYKLHGSILADGVDPRQLRS